MLRLPATKHAWYSGLECHGLGLKLTVVGKNMKQVETGALRTCLQCQWYDCLNKWKKQVATTMMFWSCVSCWICVSKAVRLAPARTPALLSREAVEACAPRLKRLPQSCWSRQGCRWTLMSFGNLKNWLCEMDLYSHFNSDGYLANHRWPGYTISKWDNIWICLKMLG